MCRTRTKTPQTTYNCDSKAANQAVGRQETQPIRPRGVFAKRQVGSCLGIQNASEIKNGTTPGMKIDPCIGLHHLQYIYIYIFMYTYIYTYIYDHIQI